MRGDYSRAGSLKQAVEICRRSLEADGREDYARTLSGREALSK